MPSAEAQFDGALEGLDEDESLDLVALMWIGRGDFEPEEWEEARQLAREAATLSTADYLKGVPLLADYLEAGLEAVGVDVRGAEDDAMGG
jgi:hypothetical protein